MQTSSSLIRDFLETKELGYEFNIHDVQREFPDMSHGAISGFLNRLKFNKYTQTRSLRMDTPLGARLVEVHTLEKSLHDLVIRDNIKENRKSGGGNQRGPTTRERLCEMVMTIGTEIERMKVSLADYTTDELIAELGKRAKR